MSISIMLSDYTRRRDELIEESRREAEDDVTALETVAREHMREAVKLIVWEMYDECQ